MKVFVAGSTGVLGKRLVGHLDDDGHEVVGLTRDEKGDTVVEERGGVPRRGDVLDAETLADAVDDDTDVVVHAATAIPTKQKPTHDDWETNDRIRREGTQNLTDVAEEAGAERYVQQSVVWVARQPDGSEFNEDSPTHPVRTTESALDAERIARTRGGDGDFEVAVLRGGWFYSDDSAHTRMIGEGLTEGEMPVIGGGVLGRKDAVLSAVHVEDAAGAFATVATAESADGLWHVVDDEPVTYADFLREFADELDAPSPRRVPGWVARFLVGKDTVQLLTNSMPTSNEKLRRDFGWSPEFPTYREGIRDVVENWVDEGTVVRDEDGYEWNAE